MTDYAAFLSSKRRAFAGVGLSHAPALPAALYPFQAAIVRWALRKGRAAIFADCGLGKTPMQLAWARALNVPTLILAPLCVAEQTVAEGRKFGIRVGYAQEASDVAERITITNYERLDRFDPAQFQAVVLDESSILKAFDGKTRSALIAAFAQTPYRLCCTATPSPNDISELANHAEFLGLMTRPEFLATWFIRIGAKHRTTTHHGWRMKRHAATPFYEWLASWAVACRTPSDLGYPDDGFILPSLRIEERVLSTERPPEGFLFPGMEVKGLRGRLAARRASLDDRVHAVASLVRQCGGQWVLWCGLNVESDAIADALPGSVNVQGSDDYAEKVGAVQAFTSGDLQVLITKAKILGFGLNLQRCHQMAFVGIGDSYETYYQCIRRCWRFGQTAPVTAWIVVSEAETGIVQNVRRKEETANAMNRALLAHVAEIERRELCA